MKHRKVGKPVHKVAREAKQLPMQADDITSLIHPELREGTAAAAEIFAAMPALSDGSLAQFRSLMADFARPAAEDIPVERKAIPGPDGHGVPVFVVNARSGTSRPAILHTHGGGFVGGGASYEVRTQQGIAAELDCVCVTVDYRLAPEARWRSSLSDNYAALSWLHRHAAELGVDPARIALMGESAGGGHAALLAIEARDRGEIPLVLQLLVYPMLDDRTGSTRHPAEHIGTMIWPDVSNSYGWRSFLGVTPGGRSVPVAAVPARVSDLAGLPPAFIGVGALDLFVEEDVAYAQRLIAAGVPTELHVVPGAVHGFDEFVPDAPVVRQFAKLKMDALRRAFGISLD